MFQSCLRYVTLLHDRLQSVSHNRLLPLKVEDKEETQKATASRAAAKGMSVDAAVTAVLSDMYVHFYNITRTKNSIESFSLCFFFGLSSTSLCQEFS